MSSKPTPKIERFFFGCAFERLYRSFKVSQRSTEKQVAAALKQLNSICSNKKKDSSNVTAALQKVYDRLAILERRLGQFEDDERSRSCTVKRRIDVANDLDTLEKKRLSILLIDFLLRSGKFKTARCLAEVDACDGLGDFDTWEEANAITSSLKNCDVTSALRWCADNKSKLRKLDSVLEFQLRIQEFMELIRKGEKSKAIIHARKYFQDAATNSKKRQLVQQVMTTLAFADGVDIPPGYASLYSEKRWEALSLLFSKEHKRVHSLPRQSPLVANLKVGLSALKTECCYNENTRSPDCPTCDRIMNRLAENLPRLQHKQTRLVCRIGHEPMDEANPPMVLPSGNCYGARAMNASSKRYGGKVCDPQTGEFFDKSEMRRAYIC
eukprot:g1944.t1